MYDYIKGIYTYKNTDSNGYFVTLETNGTGYFFEIIQRDYESIKEINSEIMLYCVLIHREDKMSLCGFLKRESRDMFNILTSVSGVGVKMALALLNSFMVPELITIVLNEDYKSLMAAKGVGQKLAQKIIIELRGKFDSYKNINSVSNKSSVVQINSANTDEAQSVLLSLGYETQEIKNVFDNIRETITHDSSTEEILRKALKLLSV